MLTLWSTARSLKQLLGKEEFKSDAELKDKIVDMFKDAGHSPAPFGMEVCEPLALHLRLVFTLCAGAAGWVLQPRTQPSSPGEDGTREAHLQQRL